MSFKNKIKLSKKEIAKNPLYFLAFGLGSGFMPFMPGTFGTILGVLVYGIFNYFNWPQVVLLLTIFTGFFLGIYICGKTAKACEYHDHPGIVFDEVIGYLVAMLYVPYGSWVNIILGFILFRIFDIVKPWPIKQIDQTVHGGFGIMLDDILAGVYANIVLHIFLYYV